MLKTFLLLTFCVFAFAGTVVAQDNKPIKIALKSTSTTPAAYLTENLPPAGCSNIQIVTDESAADYLLEAQGGDIEGPNGSAGKHGPHPPHPKSHYTLYQKGAVVFETTPIKEKSAVKDVCKFLQKGSSK